MTLYDQLWAACQPYWTFRANDVHIPVVYGFAQELLKHYPVADESIVLLAAMMHDNGYARVPEETLFKGLSGAPIGFQPDITRLHEIEGVKIARELLQAVGYDPLKTETICEIIDGHDSRLHSLSLEDSLVKDADKLWRFTIPAVEISGKQWMKMEPLAFLNHSVSKIDSWIFTAKAKELAYVEAEKTRRHYRI